MSEYDPQHDLFKLKTSFLEREKGERKNERTNDDGGKEKEKEKREADSRCCCRHRHCCCCCCCCSTHRYMLHNWIRKVIDEISRRSIEHRMSNEMLNKRSTNENKKKTKKHTHTHTVLKQTFVFRIHQAKTQKERHNEGKEKKNLGKKEKYVWWFGFWNDSHIEIILWQLSKLVSSSFKVFYSFALARQIAFYSMFISWTRIEVFCYRVRTLQRANDCMHLIYAWCMCFLFQMQYDSSLNEKENKK